MKKHELQTLVVECLQEYFVDTQRKPVRGNTMKKSALKALVNEVVRQVVKEAGPQYKVVTGRSYVEQPGKVNRAREIQCDPLINELAPGGLEGVEGMEDHPYDEQEEIEILKRIALDLIRLLKMHNAMEAPESNSEPESPEQSKPFGGGQFGGGQKASPFASKGSSEEPSEEPEGPTEKPTEEPSEPEEPTENDEEDEIDENHKVQDHSYRTIKDVPQNPKNVRNPKVPMA